MNTQALLTFCCAIDFFLITLQANCDRKENHWSRDFVWNVLFVAVLEGCRMVSL